MTYGDIVAISVSIVPLDPVNDTSSLARAIVFRAVFF